MRRFLFGFFVFSLFCGFAEARTEGFLQVDFTPAENTLFRRGETVEMGTVSFSAETEKITLSRISFELSGTVDGERDLARARLFADEILIGSGGKIGKEGIVFSDLGNFVVRPEEPQSLRLELEISRTAHLGATLGVILFTSDAVKVETDKYNVRTVMGDFPFSSPKGHIVGISGDFFLASFASDSSSSEFFPLGKDVPIAHFFLQNLSEHSLEISDLRMRIDGDFPREDIEKIVLKDNKKILSVGDFSSKNELLFATPLVLLAGEKRSFEIVGDFDSAGSGDLVFEWTNADFLPSDSAAALGDFPLRSAQKTASSSLVLIDPQSNTSSRLFSGQQDAIFGHARLFSPVSSETVSDLSFAFPYGSEIFSSPVFARDSSGNILSEGAFFDGRLHFSSPFLVSADTPLLLDFVGNIRSDAPIGSFTLFDIAASGGSSMDISSGVFGRFSISETSEDTFAEVIFEPSLSPLFAGIPDAEVGTLSFDPKNGSLELSQLILRSADFLENPRLLNVAGEVLSEGKKKDGDISFSLLSGFSGMTSFRIIADVSADALGQKIAPTLSADGISLVALKNNTPAAVSGDFPFLFPSRKVLSPKKNPVFFQIENSMGKLLSRGEKDVFLLSFSLSSEQEARIDRLLISFPEGPDRFLSAARLLGEDGQRFSGRIDANFVAFDTSFRIPAGTTKRFSLSVDIADGAPIDELFVPVFLGEQSFVANASVVAHFPVKTGASRVALPETCSEQKTFVCGKKYGSSVEEKRYDNACFLRADSAVFVSEGECSDTEDSVLSFSDLSPESEFFDAALFLKDKGILSGFEDGTFRSNAPISRAAFVKILVGAHFSEEEIAECNLMQYSFPDVPSLEWFAPFVCVAKRESLVSGFPDGTFRPSETLSFAAAAKMIARSFDASIPEDSEIWYDDFVGFLSEKKAIPISIKSAAQKMTRGEISEILYRLLEKIEKRESAQF